MKTPLFVTLVFVLFSDALFAVAPRVMPNGKSPDDCRLLPLKDLDGYFPFDPSKSVEDWRRRAEARRRMMRISLGLWPMPTQTPANAVVHGRLEFDNYTIDKVFLESFPGFYITGNLYLPKRVVGKLPVVLCPHGHFVDGRFGDEGLEAVRQNIVIGAERFENGGRNGIQSKCVQLARMGCAVFNYDMIGYCDSLQISFDLAHRFAKQRPETNSKEGWGLFSPQAEARLQSVMGMQSYNSIRALDWVVSLPFVDPQRIGVTGASGGGTQTFILCALDDRPTVAVPAVMVSTAMQGGCTCENASLLRIGTGNVEFAAMFAPRPMCLISADDWTRDMSTKGFPDLKRHYEMMGAADNLMHAPFLHFGHNYNYVSRAVLYRWINQHFQLGLAEPIVEEDYQRLTGKELSVWDTDHPAPVPSTEFERKLLKWWDDDAQRQIAAARPTSKDTLTEYRRLVGGGVDGLIGHGLPASDRVRLEGIVKSPRKGYLEMTGSVRHDVESDQYESIPTVFLMPNDWNKGTAVIWLTGNGKNDLYTESGEPKPFVRKLLDRGVSVVGADLFMQGEFTADGKSIDRTRRVDNDRESASYTFGYNHSLFAQRVHDILSLVSFTKNHGRNPSHVHVVGVGGAGPWVAAARVQAAGAISRAVIDTQGFRFSDVVDIHDPNFLPGGVKYDDLPGMLAVSAPEPLLMAGEKAAESTLVRVAYGASGGPAHLTISEQKEEDFVHEAIDWLTVK